jgi:phage pi2 protein 07
MKSKITGGETTLLFKAKVLSEYMVSYYKCNDTGFIQTEEPYWLEKAYDSAITKLDVGLVMRNQNLSVITEKLLLEQFNHNSIFLDYAGGYGLFTRMMRDKGFNFYNTDKFCQNIFAEYQDLKELPPGTNFELVTAFEVFEHLTNPLGEIEEMLPYGKNILFSTEIVPENTTQPTDWWYFSLETGQHVAFYTIKALEFISKKFNKHFYTDGKGLHLFCDEQLSSNPFDKNTIVLKKENYFIRKMRRTLRRFDSYLYENSIPKKESLLDFDWNDAKKRITK